MAGLFGGGGGNPKSHAPRLKVTAPTVGEQLSEQDKKNRLLASSALTQSWQPPKLGKAALLGMA